MSGRAGLAETATPDGVRVVLYADTWREHVLDPRTGHGELRSHLDSVISAVAAPDHREPDPRPGRERFYRRNVGPSRWLMVVVSFEEDPARIVTALGYGHGRSPSGWMP
ncbi:MAG TPA: hypothetical protein VNC40_00830 [Gaiellaceae bacterium]|nr:hypothetical protein [Gaiellaceae bacterium]